MNRTVSCLLVLAAVCAAIWISSSPGRASGIAFTYQDTYPALPEHHVLKRQFFAFDCGYAVTCRKSGSLPTMFDDWAAGSMPGHPPPKAGKGTDAAASVTLPPSIALLPFAILLFPLLRSRERKSRRKTRLVIWRRV